MPLKTIFSFLLILFILEVNSQGLNCGESDPFCTGTIYTFPAGTTGAAEAGPYYGCLSSQPAPAWYHMKIGSPGPITIYMHSEPQHDIDFACWGPFTDPISACPNGLTQTKMVDCCYCSSWEEYCDIPNGQTGEYYIMLITNYSQQPCNIIFSQTAGSGTTDCSILPPLVSSDSPLCIGETLHLTAETISNATYSWTGPAGFTSSQQNPVIPNVTLAMAGDYACVITIYSQSSPPAITSVVINDLPDAGLITTDTTVCPGAPAYMPVQLTGAGPFEVIYYNGSSYFTVPGLNGPVDTIFVNPPGPATYNLTQVSDTNCTKVLSGICFNVFNYPAASGSLTGGETICPGDTAELVFNLTGTAPWTITFMANGMNPVTLTADVTPFIVPVTPVTTTTYQFTQLSDAYCAGSAYGTAVVMVDYPAGILSGNNTICAGEGTQLIFTLTGFPPWTVRYTANGENEQTITAPYSPYAVPVSPMECTLYECTFLEDVFCTGAASGQAQVDVHLPTGVMEGEADICNGESANIIFTLTGNPPWVITYLENGANPQTVTAYSTPYSLVVTPVVSTTYSFSELEDNSCTGEASGEASVTVKPQPGADAGADKTIPNGTSTTLDGNVTGGSGSYTYMWEPADKLVDPGIIHPSTTNLYSSAIFTLTATDDSGGCFDQDQVLVTITGGALSCNATAYPETVCSGQVSQLQAIASGGSGNYTYQWSSDPPGFSSGLQSPVVTVTENTSYYVTINDGYNVTNANTHVSVNQLPLPDAGTDQVIAYGTIATLHGNAVSGSGQYAFHWEPAYKLNDPDISEPTTLNIYETSLFSLTVTDAQTGCLCNQPDEAAIMISGSALAVNPQAQPATICQGDSTRLFSLAGGGTGMFTYSWTSSPPGFTSSLADPYVAPGDNTVYSVHVSDGFNSASGSVGVTVNNAPSISLGSDTTVCVFDTIMLDAGNPGSTYVWSNGSTERQISVGSTGIGYENKMVYVTVTSPQGCTGTAMRTIAFDFVACSGLNDLEPGYSFYIYPNPGQGMLSLVFQGIPGIFHLDVIDWLGKTVLQKDELLPGLSHSPYLLDLREFPDGIYLMRIVVDGAQAGAVKYILSR